MDQVGRRQPCLLKAGCVEIVATAHPQHRSTSMSSLSRSDACQEQRCRGIIDHRTALCGDLVQCSCAKAPACEAIVERGDTERHDAVIHRWRRDCPQMGDGRRQGLEGGNHKV